MKKLHLASVSLGAIIVASGAQAADLSRPVYKAPAMVAPPWSWTGFYVGANIGAARARSSVSDDLGTTTFAWLGDVTSADKLGVIGGLEAGYNWQIANFVLGIEGDISFASLNRSVLAPNAAGVGFEDIYNSKLKALGTVRGRFGVAFDRALVYGTGGVAFANLEDQLTDTVFPFNSSPSSHVTGWAAGGGIEYALADHWTVKAEYLHVGFPDRTARTDSSTPFTAGYTFVFKDSLDIGRVGINYKF